MENLCKILRTASNELLNL